MKAGGGEVLISEVGLLGRESGELGEGSRSRRRARGSSLSAPGASRSRPLCSGYRFLQVSHHL